MGRDTAGLDFDARPQPDVLAGADSPARPRIILVDAVARTREDTRQVLLPHFDVRAFADGVEALAATQADPPDLVLADVTPPSVDLLRTLQHGAQTSHIPFILSSATADEDTIVAGLEAGASDFVRMPVAPRELLARVRSQAARGAERCLRANELRRAKVELEEFVYIASHDLQEPLRMVRSYVQLLEKRYRGQLDADADTYIHYAVDGAARMQGLLSDLLTLSRLDSEARPATTTDLQALFDGTLAAVKLEAADATMLITSDALPFVTADDRQLGLVLGHLLSNAIKFRKPDEPACVHVSAERDGSRWTVSVRDNGIGIDPKHSDRIFRMFQRLHTRTEYPGNGVGLPLCKKAIERAGGRIWVESEPGLGSTFRFTVADSPTVRA